jgi:hypothetical protein
MLSALASNVTVPVKAALATRLILALAAPRGNLSVVQAPVVAQVVPA